MVTPNPLLMTDATRINSVASIARAALYRGLGPVNYERLQFRRNVGYFPHLQQPRTFCEKIAHRKLFADLPEAQRLSDKVEVRNYVAQTVGEQYLNHALLIADCAEDIDFESLPQGFAAKASHGSGMNVIVADKTQVDLTAARALLAKYLRTSYGRYTNEPWYTGPRRILVEPFLRDERYCVPLDYKFFVFHGEVRFVRVMDKVGLSARDFYDADWNMADFYYWKAPRGRYVQRPSRLQEMCEVAEALAGDLEFVRVDMYCVNNERVVFGEITLAPSAGWEPIAPDGWDERIGAWW